MGTTVAGVNFTPRFTAASSLRFAPCQVLVFCVPKESAYIFVGGTGCGSIPKANLTVFIFQPLRRVKGIGAVACTPKKTAFAITIVVSTLEFIIIGIGFLSYTCHV